MTKPKILMFTLAPPLPPQSGGARYSVNTTLELCDRYDFHLFTIGGEKEREHVQKHRALYDRVFKSVHIEPRAPVSSLSTLQQVGHVITHWRHQLPFWDASYYSADAVRNAKRIVRDEGIDILEIHTSHLAFVKKFLPDHPALLVYHNIESDLFPFWMQATWSKAKTAIMSRLAKVSRANAHAVEIDNALGFDEAIFISQEDKGRVSDDAKLNKTYVPLCIPVTEQGRTRVEATRAPGPVNALWLGGFWWYPNTDAVDYFIREIFPLLVDRLASENIVLNFVGANPPDSLKAIEGPQVKVFGFVEDLDALLDEMDFLFVPMRLGSGVRVKILESMAAGLPVVSTPKGYEGLDALDERDVLDAATPDAFAEAMVKMARDPELRQRLAKNAQVLLDREYNLSDYSKVMDEVYQRMLGKLTKRSAA